MGTQTVDPSALEVLIRDEAVDKISTHPEHLHQLAAQVLHNLQYQHDWTSLTIHTAGHARKDGSKSELLVRPLVSGIPPRRVYVHPDEQIEHIKAGVKDEDLPPQREWVLPSHLREKWTLRRFANIFDAVEATPPGISGEDLGEPKSHQDGNEKWRQLKRLLLATVDDDSTITYYIVHDGIVKPRQN